MASVLCSCGNSLSDNANGLYYKANFIPDMYWEYYRDKIDEAIETSGPSPKEKEAACMGRGIVKFSG